MTTRSFASRVTVAPEVLFRLVGEEGILLNLTTEIYLGLDAVGARMWCALTENTSIEEAYEKLLDEYDVDAVQLREDLSHFLDELMEKGLVKVEVP